MRRSNKTRTAATLCLWALLGLIAHAGAAQVAAIAPGGTAIAAVPPPASLCVGRPCSAPAWPYRAQAEGADGPAREAPRRVRVIALDAAPSAR